MINQTWLNTFCTLVEAGHFTKTADILFMTQSGVSQHIKKLEQQLEVPLLIREGRGFSLTESGYSLYTKGLELLRSAAELESLVKNDEPHQGTIKIASPGSVGLKLYPFLLDIQQAHPNLIIDYAFSPNKDIEDRLAARKIDLGLITNLTTHHNLVCHKVAVEPLVLVTSCDISNVNWPLLLALGFMSHPDAAHHGQLLLSQNFTEFEHVAQFTHRGFSNQISLILEPVSRGLGFTVLPLYAVKAFSRQDLICIHPLTNTVNENLYLCSNRQAILSKRSQFIRDHIINYLGSEQPI